MKTIAPVVHICGWPGSGKLTIARALASLVGGRVIDNHLMVDPASALFERDSEDHARLRAELRAVIYRAALTLPPDVAIILTDALSDSAADFALFEPTLRLAQDRGAALQAVTLDISDAENRRRLSARDRMGRGKLTDTGILTGLRKRYQLLRPAGAVSLNVTALTAEAAALQITELTGLKGPHPHA